MSQRENCSKESSRETRLSLLEKPPGFSLPPSLCKTNVATAKQEGHIQPLSNWRCRILGEGSKLPILLLCTQRREGSGVKKNSKKAKLFVHTSLDTKVKRLSPASPFPKSLYPAAIYWGFLKRRRCSGTQMGARGGKLGFCKMLS